MPRRATKKNSRQPSDTSPLQLVMDLMAIPGQSGQEGAVMDYIERRLRPRGRTQMIWYAITPTPRRRSPGRLAIRC